MASPDPSVVQLLAELGSPPSLPPTGTKSLAPDDQKTKLHSLQAVMDSPEPDTADLQETRAALDELWACSSEHLLPSAELLANGSRNRELAQSSIDRAVLIPPAQWRAPYGRAGVLDFFLRLLASSESPGSCEVLLHALRLVGNSCADTDENRQIVVDGNYTRAIIRHVQNPALVHVVIPVMYNICVDFAPAQSQLAENRLAYILVKLIRDGAVQDDALLDFSYELIEFTVQDAHADQGIAQSPDGTLSLLVELAGGKDLSLSQLSSLASCLAAYLERKRFQDVCISNRMVDRVLSVLERSFSIDGARDPENIQSLVQLQLKINQCLAEVSASPLFLEVYPLDSPLTQTLKSWLSASEDQLQVCSCVMLGNLARSDEVCETMVRDLDIHTELISILKGDAKAAVLHSALGFLKNLAIASDNRLRLGDAGIIAAASRLWEYETVPQVQFSAVSILRQVIISCIENISRLLEPLPDSDPPQTYLSLLLSLFEKSDSTPIKIEIGRIVASMCRTMGPGAREQDSEANALLERLFSLHATIANPVGAMITQTQWPVVRSEGWFALALMASSSLGCRSVVDCLQDSEVFQLLEGTLGAEDSTEAGAMSKDRDNMAVLVPELLENENGTLSPSWRDRLVELRNSHVPRYLKGRDAS
ncbi:GTP binding protein [Aspergillus sp. HF37]|nr:GTP binding protein [Aspergillus sp. HF37]